MAEVIARALELRAPINKLCEPPSERPEKTRGRRPRKKKPNPLEKYALTEEEWLILTQLSPILAVRKSHLYRSMFHSLTIL